MGLWSLSVGMIQWRWEAWTVESRSDRLEGGGYEEWCWAGGRARECSELRCGGTIVVSSSV